MGLGDFVNDVAGKASDAARVVRSAGSAVSQAGADAVDWAQERVAGRSESAADIRAEGVDALKIYQDFHHGRGSGDTLAPKDRAWVGVADRYAQVQDDLRAVFAELGVTWSGQAAGAADARSAPMQAFVASAQDAATGTATAVRNQVGHFDSTKSAVVPPPPLPEKHFYEDLVPWGTDYDAVVGETKAAAHTNQAAYARYGTDTRGALAGLPAFIEPAAVLVDVTQHDGTARPVSVWRSSAAFDQDGPAAVTPAATTQPATGGGPVTAPPGRPGGPAGPGPVPAPTAPQGSSWPVTGAPPVTGQPAGSGPGRLPGADGAGRGRADLGAGGPGGSRGRGPDGLPGRSGAGGDGRARSDHGNHGPRVGLGSPGITDPAAGARGSAARPGVGVGGPGMPSPVTARAKGDEDTERKRPYYLVESESVFTTDELVSPAVIGDERDD